MDPKKPFTFRDFLRLIVGIVDDFAAVASPLFLILFVVLTIIALDGFGAHLQLLNSLESRYQIQSGRLFYTSGGKYAAVQLDQAEEEYASALVLLKYYPAPTLARLKEGQQVTIRTTRLPNGEERSIFEEAYADVKGYWGYLSDVLWGYALAWLVLVLHPDFLFLGFEITDSGRGRKKPLSIGPQTGEHQK